MSATPERYFARAASLKNEGQTLRAILEDLRSAGASSVDLIRVVKRTEGAHVGTAVKLIEESGLPGFDGSLTFVVPEGDPLYDSLSGLPESERRPDPKQSTD